MLLNILIVGFCVAIFAIPILVVKEMINDVRDMVYIKEYRKNGYWDLDAPEYLKYMVIPNEEYGM